MVWRDNEACSHLPSYPIDGLVGVGGAGSCHKSKKARKPSVYAGLITCHKFFRPVTFGVTNLKKLENLVFMLVSALSPMAQIYFHSIGEI